MIAGPGPEWWQETVLDGLIGAAAIAAAIGVLAPASAGEVFPVTGRSRGVTYE